MRQRVAISGASGLIGSALSSFLIERGDDVVHLVRRPARTSAEVVWDPAAGRLDPVALDGVTAVVNLAGAPVGGKRWSPLYRGEIRRSRVDATRTLAKALQSLPAGVRVVNGSAVGYYGTDRADDILTEDASAGSTFLAEVCQAWEAETLPMTDAGHSVALARTGIVLSREGGAMGKVLPLARLGAGGPLGSGQQYWPWITLVDEVRAIAWLLDHPEITGPVNLTGPEPARQGEVATAIGEALGRPAVVPAPAAALRLALGGFAEEILGGQRVVPQVLAGAGFTFEHPTLAEAVAWLVSP